MAHEDQPTVGQKVWAGKYEGPDGAFAKGHDIYKASLRLNKDRVAWASTLYSELTRRMLEAKKGNIKSLLLLLRNGAYLYPHMAHFRRDLNAPQMTPARCETIAAILGRWSKVPIFGGSGYTKAAISYAHRVFDVPQEPGGHMRALAALTLANIIRGRRGSEYLHLALVDASAIADINQRSRVYRGAAILLLDAYDDVTQARQLIDKAIGIPGLAEDVIFKNQGAYERIVSAAAA